MKDKRNTINFDKVYNKGIKITDNETGESIILSEDMIDNLVRYSKE